MCWDPCLLSHAEGCAEAPKGSEGRPCCAGASERTMRVRGAEWVQLYDEFEAWETCGLARGVVDGPGGTGLEVGQGRRL